MNLFMFMKYKCIGMTLWWLILIDWTSSLVNPKSDLKRLLSFREMLQFLFLLIWVCYIKYFDRWIKSLKKYLYSCKIECGYLESNDCYIAYTSDVIKADQSCSMKIRCKSLTLIWLIPSISNRKRKKFTPSLHIMALGSLRYITGEIVSVVKIPKYKAKLTYRERNWFQSFNISAENSLATKQLEN